FRAVAPLHVGQSPYNLFERAIEKDVLPYARRQGLIVLAYGALCRGLLSGRMRRDTRFLGDDLRQTDPKFQPRRYQQYLDAVAALDRLAHERYGRNVLALAVRRRTRPRRSGPHRGTGAGDRGADDGRRAVRERRRTHQRRPLAGEPGRIHGPEDGRLGDGDGKDFAGTAWRDGHVDTRRRIV